MQSMSRAIRHCQEHQRAQQGSAMISTTRISKLLFAGVVFLLVCAGQVAAQSWTQLAPTGGPPVARILHSAAFNTVNNRMIVFGGLDGGSGCYAGQCLNDVWVLTNADGSGGSSVWTQLSPTGGPPSARGFQAATYDAANNRMIVFAGDPNIGFCGATVNDTWVLTNADGTGGTPTWTQLSPTGGPPAIGQGSSAVYDPATNRMTVFGGNTTACGPYSNATWVLTNANGLGGTPAWTLLNPAASPPARNSHTSVYNVANNRMIVFAGVGNSGALNDVWVLANANGVGTPAWILLSPTGTPPPARYFSTSVYDPATNRMVVFGGSATSGLVNDVWMLSHADGTGGTPAWTQLSPTGTPPAARYAHTAVYNAANNRMVVFGGSDGSYLNDTWVLSSASGIIDLPVGIDIRPGSTLNNISLSHDRNLPVAIFSTATFDAPGMVDKTSLTFGHSGTEKSFAFCDAPKDVNGDGRLDLVCHFTIKLSGFQMGDTLGYLKGGTLVGNAIHGSDLVRIIQ
jgi:hypothetical protein